MAESAGSKLRIGSPLGIGLAVGRFALILTNTLLALDVNNEPQY